MFSDLSWNYICQIDNLNLTSRVKILWCNFFPFWTIDVSMTYYVPMLNICGNLQPFLVYHLPEHQRNKVKFVNLVLPTHQNWRNNRVNNSIQILFVAHSTIKQRLRLIRSDWCECSLVEGYEQLIGPRRKVLYSQSTNILCSTCLVIFQMFDYWAFGSFVHLLLLKEYSDYIIDRWLAAQWNRQRLPFCGRGFKSHAQHLRFFSLYSSYYTPIFVWIGMWKEPK